MDAEQYVKEGTCGMKSLCKSDDDDEDDNDDDDDDDTEDANIMAITTPGENLHKNKNTAHSKLESRGMLSST